MTGQTAWVGATLTNMLPTGFAVLSIERLEAATAERAAVLHDVSLPSQDSFTLEAAEMLHVPVATLGFCALVSKNDLWRETQDRGWRISMYHLSDKAPPCTAGTGSQI